MPRPGADHAQRRRYAARRLVLDFALGLLVLSCLFWSTQSVGSVQSVVLHFFIIEPLILARLAWLVLQLAPAGDRWLRAGVGGYATGLLGAVMGAVAYYPALPLQTITVGLLVGGVVGACFPNRLGPGALRHSRTRTQK